MAERILVIGNCQAPSVAQLLSHIVPGASAEGFSLNMEAHAKDELAERVPEYDLVFAQPHQPAKAGPLALEELQRRHSCVVTYPQIMFSGFHPDFIGGGDGSRTRSAAMGYHSAIVAVAYSNGVPVDSVEKLLNPFNFAKLGYYSEYENGKKFLLSRAEKIGYDLTEDFRSWEVGGVFMHTPNHPFIHVLASVAAKAAATAGLPVQFESADGVEDRLGAQARLPVYPAIAKRLKVKADTLFSIREPQGVRTFDLAEYVSRTYQLYADVPPSFFEHPRIQRVAAALRDAG